MIRQDKVIGVFGGGGFLGRYVISLLASDGYLIKVGGRHPEHYTHLKVGNAPGQLHFQKVDVRSFSTLDTFIEGCDAVINLVGILFEKGDQRFEALHTYAAEKIASLCAKKKVQHLIYVSALGAHLQSPSLYARTKAEAEQSLLHNFPTATILRPSLLFGAEDHFFNRFAKMMQFSPLIPVFNKGKTRFQPVYVLDVARAIKACLDTTLHDHNDTPILHVQGKTFELGGPDILTFEELLEKIMDIIQRPKPIVHLPAFCGYGLSLLSKILPSPLLTMDQLRLLKSDSVCREGSLRLQDLNISPVSPDTILPLYLNQFSKSVS